VVTIRLLDKDTGAELAAIPVLVGVSEAQNATSSARPRVCTRENTADCTQRELIAIEAGENFIGQNVSDFYLLAGIVAAFAFIVLVFFVVLPRK
jgi:hypothetical protein